MHLLKEAFRFKLKLVNGETVELTYDPHTSELLNVSTQKSLPEESLRNWASIHNSFAQGKKDRKEAQTFSPETPATKSSLFKTLKIQLGLGCNYSCSYCLQNKNRVDLVSSLEKAQAFTSQLSRWLEIEEKSGKGFDVQFWGGEPLLYWQTLHHLIKFFRQKYPDSKLSFVSNATLLTKDIVDELEKHNVHITISHDGPGYEMQRGKDPLEDPFKLSIIRYAYERLHPKGKITFNCVLTKNNYSLRAIRLHISERIGTDADELPLTTEEALSAYDETGVKLSFNTPDLQQDLINVNFWESLANSSLHTDLVSLKMGAFAESLLHKTSSKFISQKCGMDSPHKYAVDLDGNILTCQNVTADAGHKIGHVDQLENVALNTGWHWSKREECSTCPVLHLCKGSCLYNSGKFWVQSCDNAFFYNLYVLASFFFYTQNLFLLEISGDMMRGKGPTSVKVLREDLVEKYISAF